MQIRFLLIVDDDVADAQDTCEKLSNTKLEIDEVIVASTLADAIVTITNNEVDVVILDLNLADSKAIPTLLAVRAITDAVIIVLADLGEEILAAEALASGADDFLLKRTMNNVCVERSIIKSITHRKIRRVSKRIEEKITTLATVVGAQ